MDNTCDYGDTCTFFISPVAKKEVRSYECILCSVNVRHSPSRSMIILSQQQAYPRKGVIITTPLIRSEIKDVHTSEEEDEDDDNTVFTKLATFLEEY